MPALLRSARFWVVEHRLIAAISAGVLVLGLSGLAYALLKRPNDIQNVDAPFHVQPTPKVHYTNWPIYRFDAARTSYLPAEKVKPPFTQIWRFEAKHLTEFSPVFAEGKVFGLNNAGTIFALDASSGKPRWERKLGALNASSPAYYNGRVFVVNLEPQQVYALDAKTGRIVWRKPLPGRSESSPIVVDGKLIFGCENGDLFAVSPKNGKTIWTAALGGAVKAAPAYDKGVLYVGDYGDHMSAVNIKNGSIKWQSNAQGASLGRSGEFYSTPAVAFGRVYSGNNDGRVYSFETSNGSIAWSHSTGGYVYGSPAVADTPETGPTVYVGSFDRNLYALDARSGNVIWSHLTPGRISGGATVVGEIVYYSDFDTTSSYGLNVKTGKLVWKDSSGAYNPVISDGRRIFLTGFSSFSGLKASKPAKAKAKVAKAKNAKTLTTAP